MSARDVFVGELNKRFDLPGKYHPHWEPISPCALGDVGRKEDGDWQRTGDAQSRELGDLGTPIHGPAAPMSFAAGQEISIRGALKGAMGEEWSFIGKAKAGIKFQFGRNDSLIVIAPDTSYEQLPDDQVVANRMIEAWRTGRLAFLDEVVVGALRTSSGMVLASAQTGASVDVTSETVVREGAIDVGEIRGRLAISNQSGMSYARSFPEGFVLGYRSLVLKREGVFSPKPGPIVEPAAAAVDLEMVMPLPA